MKMGVFLPTLPISYVVGTTGKKFRPVYMVVAWEIPDELQMFCTVYNEPITIYSFHNNIRRTIKPGGTAKM